MTPEAKKARYKQLSQPLPEEAIERTDGRHISTSEVDDRKGAQSTLAAPRPLVRRSSGRTAGTC